MSIDKLKQEVAAANLEKRMKNDFRVFVWYCWKTINLPNPTDIQKDLSQTLQKPPSKRFIIQGFRGVAKSFITCAYVVWRLWRNPQLKIMIVSASKTRADANAKFIRQLLREIPFLAHLKPRDGQQDTQNIFDVGPATPDISPSVKSVGITGQLTGSRADIIIADDVEVPGNSSTQTARDKLSELVKEFDAILKPDEHCEVIYLGTPQNEQSLYNVLLTRGYTTLIWPARYPRDAKQRANYGSKLAPFIAERYDADPEGLAWKPTDPKRFTDSDLIEREISYGKAGFALQFMLDTSLSDAEKYPLRLRDLIVAEFSKTSSPMSWEWLPGPETALQDAPNMGLKGDGWFGYRSASKETSMFTGKVMSIDPSGRGKDETGYAVVYYLNGYLFLMESGGFRGGYEDTTLEKLAQVAKKWEVQDVVVESNFGDGMFNKLFSPVLSRAWKCGLSEVRSKGQKEVRIADVLEPLMGAHKLVVYAPAIAHDYNTAVNADGTHDPSVSLFHQMTRLTREKGSLAHDDRLDALAIACAFFVESMSQDDQKGIQQAQEDWLEEHMEDPIRGYQDAHAGIMNGVSVTWETVEDDDW
ncbi:DNA packaging protein [Delftia phage IME-DE1]|uniref:Terminase, large subunit n=1 Tax=Delftia phage IME-DE1 TaxID=1647385 RepID=A0A0F7IKP8_9CAUD|nr:terminase large subunit [Delftia phage IME-DE1]AKG94472.1 DNA packaging protein [Delftia phage IME-DE1]